MRTPTRLLAAAATAALVLTACGGGNAGEGSSDASGEAAAPAGETTLSMLVPSYSDNTKTLWEGLIADFEDDNDGITVDLEVQSWDNINDVVRTKLQANDAPDILNIDAFASFAADDLLYPAIEVASEETIADIQDSFAENASIDGTMYGFPLIASTRTMFYNQDLLDQAGVEVPTTWDELQTASVAISELGGGVSGYGMPLGSEEAQGETSIWTFGGGGSWTDGEAITVDTPDNVAAVEAMKGMIDAGATQADAGATDRTPLLNVFIQGQIGFIVGLPPTVDQIAEKNPDLNYGTAPIATQDGSPVTLGVADHLMAFDTGEDKAEAIKAFIDFFYAPDNYLTFADGEGFLPTTKSGADSTENAEKFASFLDGLASAKFYPSTNPDWPTAQAAIQNRIGLIGQGDDPATVMADIQAQVDQS